MAVIAIAHTPLGSKSLPPLIQFSMVWLLYHKIDELAVIVSARGNRGHAECPLWVISGHFRQSSFGSPFKSTVFADAQNTQLVGGQMI